MSSHNDMVVIFPVTLSCVLFNILSRSHIEQEVSWSQLFLLIFKAYTVFVLFINKGRSPLYVSVCCYDAPS